MATETVKWRSEGYRVNDKYSLHATATMGELRLYVYFVPSESTPQYHWRVCAPDGRSLASGKEDTLTLAGLAAEQNA